MWAKIEKGQIKVFKSNLPTFDSMQRYVGYIQQVPFRLNDGSWAVLLVDEDAWMKKERPDVNFYFGLHNQFIAGNVILLGMNPTTGAWTHLNKRQMDLFRIDRDGDGPPTLMWDDQMQHNLQS